MFEYCSFVSVPYTHMNASTALTRLQQGNARFVAGTSNLSGAANATQRSRLSAGQSPFAIVLGCADSRVPPELVFDQGLGELFVVRVAGNIAATSQICSIEFAVEQFAVPLVIVLGHSQCGAVGATIDCLTTGNTTLPGNIYWAVNHIRPAIEPLLHEKQADAGGQLMAQAVRANIQAAVTQLRNSPLLGERIDHGALSILGAEYALPSGKVKFFDHSG